MWQISAYRVLDRLVVSVAYYHADRELGQRWQAWSAKDVDVSNLDDDSWMDELAVLAEELLDVAYDRESRRAGQEGTLS